MKLLGFAPSLVGAVWFVTHGMAAENAGLKNDYAWIRGANYVPSYARNDVQTWMDYKPALVDCELGYAANLKLNCVRVFLQAAVYERDPKRFLDYFDSFLSLCEKHHIQMMPDSSERREYGA